MEWYEKQNQWFDCFQILNITEKANNEEIKKAFRTLIKKYHPDNPLTGNREEYQKIKLAYETIKNKEKREKYIEYSKNYKRTYGKNSKEDTNKESVSFEDIVKSYKEQEKQVKIAIHFMISKIEKKEEQLCAIYNQFCENVKNESISENDFEIRKQKLRSIELSGINAIREVKVLINSNLGQLNLEYENDKLNELVDKFREKDDILTCSYKQAISKLNQSIKNQSSTKIKKNSVALHVAYAAAIPTFAVILVGVSLFSSYKKDTKNKTENIAAIEKNINEEEERINSRSSYRILKRSNTEDSNVIVPKDMYPNKEEWEQLGFVFSDITEDDWYTEELWYKATLPEGWNIVKGKVFNEREIRDENGLKRVIIYEDPIYLHMAFSSRYNVCEEYDFDAHVKEVYFGNDKEKLFVGQIAGSDPEYDTKVAELKKMAKQFGDENYPDWEDIYAYWDNENELNLTSEINIGSKEQYDCILFPEVPEDIAYEKIYKPLGSGSLHTMHAERNGIYDILDANDNHVLLTNVVSSGGPYYKDGTCYVVCLGIDGYDYTIDATDFRTVLEVKPTRYAENSKIFYLEDYGEVMETVVCGKHFLLDAETRYPLVKDFEELYYDDEFDCDVYCFTIDDSKYYVQADDLTKVLKIEKEKVSLKLERKVNQ